jgi:hypothetical protein
MNHGPMNCVEFVQRLRAVVQEGVKGLRQSHAYTATDLVERGWQDGRWKGF